MNRFALVGGSVILPDRILEKATVYWVGDTIDCVSEDFDIPSAVISMDVRGSYIAPGFIDLHVHGGRGADFMDGTQEAVSTAARAHLFHGSTTLFPTTTTGSAEQILTMVDTTQQAAAEAEMPSLPGIHLYGPYFAADKVGCHSLAGRRSPESVEYEQYFNSGFIRIATCAAELPGAEHFYRAAADHGCFITCGHSNASWNEMQLAFDCGMRHVDHFWCAMSGVASLRQRLGVPMQASMAEFVLMNQEMSTEVIADGCHLAPELLEFAYRMIGPNRLCLVTDCNRALDMPAGDYRFGNSDDGSWFKSDGRVGWAPDGNSLASSVVGMDHMVRHMHQSTSASLPEVIRMASLTPALRAGIGEQAGSLEAGKRADMLVLDAHLNIQQVILRGQPLKFE